MLIDLETNETNRAVEIMCKRLDMLWNEHLHDIDFANIEQQPEKQHVVQRGSGPQRKFVRMRDNTQMKSISGALQGYFLGKGKQVQFISPKSKLTVWKGEKIDINSKSKDPYYRRKRESIAHALRILKEAEQNYWAIWLEALSKKDDVADAYLQCCYALERFKEPDNGIVTL